MKKKLFLLMLALVGTYPTVYCADGGGDGQEPAFVENIDLASLEGERIDDIDDEDWFLLNNGYQVYLCGATSIAATSLSFAFTMCVLKYLNNSVESRYPLLNWILYYLVEGLQIGVSGGTSFLVGLYSFAWILNKSWETGFASQGVLREPITEHNAAVGDGNGNVDYAGMISEDEDGRRTLTMRHNERGWIRRYLVDQWAERRREAISGIFKKILLGPESVRRVRAINEQLDAFEKQLQPDPYRIKGDDT